MSNLFNVRSGNSQVEKISHHPLMDTLLKTAAGLLVVLDQDRQIVTVNHAFLKELGIEDVREVLGFRLGQSMKCIHADKKPDGCGTTDYCVSCGANIAIRAAMGMEPDQFREEICALISDREGSRSDICLKIKAKPVVLKKTKWILVYAQDITRQQFWANLERVFFHDINNSLTALYGSAQLLQLKKPFDEDIAFLNDSIERLMGEVDLQKNFSKNRITEYNPVGRIVELEDIRHMLHTTIDGHKAAFGKEIHEEWPRQSISLETDTMLVSKVLCNMVINALEATPMGSAIQIRVEADAEQVTWNVHNTAHIPTPIQKRIFQRHFSRKSEPGRGLGTYSMKLFGEEYLKGKVNFRSSPKDGTTFSFRLPR
ncbi:MAG: PAS domain-containing sensor histidine kinase [Desulfobacterales bacterium]|nr:PAS domain-containing sensor histidine kinase [Desulfobacterales bacterium]